MTPRHEYTKEMIRKATLLLSALFVATAATSQNAEPTQIAPRCTRTVSLNDVRNLPDAQLQHIGEQVSALGFPARTTAVELLQQSHAQAPSSARREHPADRPAYASYQSSDTLFWESFEGWDGMSMPWIPSSPNKWSTKSAISDLTPYLSSGSCPTWSVYEGDGYYIPYATAGSQMLLCMFGEEAYGADGVTVTAPAPQQDEWLVSPAINGISATNYLSFDICYSPFNTHYFVEQGDTAFDQSRVAYDVEVLITTSTRSASFDAGNYEVAYKLSEEVDKELASIDMDDEEALSQLLYMNWHHVQIPLSQYDESNIRVALRYTGSKGGAVMVDALRISDLLPTALYDIPVGGFYWGFSDEMYSMTSDQTPYKFAFLPAYVPTIWQNISNEDAQEYTWTYTAEGASAQSHDKDLAMPAQAPASLTDMPILLATAGKRADEVQEGWYNVGGNTQMTFSNGQTVVYNVGNYDLTKSWWTAEIGNMGSGMYVFGTNSGSFWAAASNYLYTGVDGIANYFERPLSPYVFNVVTLPLGDYLNFGAPLVCTIYKVIDGYVSDEVLAQCIYDPNSTTPRGSCEMVPNTAGMYTLKFLFDTPLVIDDAIFIAIDGFSNSNMIAIAPIAQAMNHDNGIGYAFVKLNISSEYGGGFQFVEVAGALSSVDGGSNMDVSHCIGLNAVFPFLHSNDGDVFTVADGGESKEFAFSTYWSPSDWSITCSDNWFTAEPVVDELAQTVSVRISADALPSSVSGRNGTVTVSALGCEQTILVLQGEDVNGIQPLRDDSSEAIVYNLQGQRVNESANGLLLVKQGGRTLKIWK